MKFHNLSLIALIALTAIPLRLAAAEGRIPIAGSPLTITVPGNYYLTRTLAASSTAITISADDVNLDLNGQTISLTGSGYGVYSLSHTRLRIANGRITGGDMGVLLNSTGAVTVENLVLEGQISYGIYISGTSAAVPATARVLNNQLQNISGANAIGMNFIYLHGGQVTGNLVRNVSSATGLPEGVHVANSDGIRVCDNVIEESRYAGFDINYSTNCMICRNIVSGTLSATSYGIILVGLGSTGNTIEWNTVSGNVGQAITINGNNNIYAYNRTSGNGTNGVTLGGGSTGNQSGGGNCSPAPTGCS